MATMHLPALSSQTGLTHYLREIQKFPLLEPEEEYMLAKRYVEHEDMKAAHRLVTSHLRLVVKIASKFRGYGLPFSEMIAEGNIGLMQAVKRFDPERGFRLSTYAIWWIKASIQEYVLRSWSLVKMGTSLAQKKLFFNLRRLKQQLNAIDNTDLLPDQVRDIAATLNVEEEDVVAMNRRMIANDRSFNAPVSSESSDEWGDFFADPSDSPEELVLEADESNRRHSLLHRAMLALNERERDIFAKRRLAEPPVTLEELSQHYSISRERVRQIENRAFEKVQGFIVTAPESQAQPA